MANPLRALRASTDHLAEVVAGLKDRLGEPAYPAAWTVADVVSHLGSGAVIFGRRLDDAEEGHATSEAFSRDVWAEWDAKSPQDKAADGLAADEALTARLERYSPDDAATISLQLGPLRLDFAGLVRLRLNEHAVHTWDLDVVSDARAELSALATENLVDNLELVARFSGRPGERHRDVSVRTTTPTRLVTVGLGGEYVRLDVRVPSAADEVALQLPAAAFVRLVYGRLDPAHTPPEVTGDPEVLELLRVTFPGP